MGIDRRGGIAATYQVAERRRRCKPIPTTKVLLFLDIIIQKVRQNAEKSVFLHKNAFFLQKIFGI